MRVLVIGQGSIGQRHARVLSDQLSCTVEVVTKAVNSPWTRYSSLESVGDLSRFDYFVIATETVKHRAQLAAIDAAVANRRILVEKPLFADCSDTDTISGRNAVWVGYNLRFHPMIMHVKRLIASRRVFVVNVQAGEYMPWWRKGADYRTSYSATRDLGGGVARDLSHEIDYVTWLFGSLEAVTGIAGTFSNLGIDSDDVCLITGRTKGGAAVSIGIDYLDMLPVRVLRIHAEGMTIEADIEHGRLKIGDAEHHVEEFDYSGVERDLTYREMHRAILERGGDVCCTFAEGLSVMQTLGRIDAVTTAKDIP